jgi:glycosyltransferase involved in cell wall biosynthesis
MSDAPSPDLPTGTIRPRPLRVAATLEQCWHRVPGGTATSIIGAVGALAARPDTEVVGVSARHRHAPDAPWSTPVPTRALPLPRRLLYESWHRLRRPRVERAVGPVDVVYATTFAIPPRHEPLVVTVHDLAFLHDPTHFTRHGLRFFARGLELARRDADLVTCPSVETRDDCIRHGFDPDRLRVIPWGVDSRRATEADVAAVRARHRLDRPFVLWVGTIEPRKNLPRLLEAFAGLDDSGVDLVLVGPTGWNEELAPLVDRMDRPPRRLGFVDPADLDALYAAAEVFCYPSLREGFGLPVLEAMAQGTPVVTSADSAMAEVAGDAAVLVAPRDVGEIAAALARLLGSPDEARRRGAEGRQRAQLFTWERVGEQLSGVLHEAAGGTSR